MTAPRRTPRDTVGGAVGASVAALAIAAHGAAGGDLPDSTGIALVGSVAVVAGALAAGLPRSRFAVFALLSLGQLGAHAALSGLTAHDHPATAAPLSGFRMVFAHIVATLVCGTLLLLARRVYETVTATVRAVTTRPHALVVAALTVVTRPNPPLSPLSSRGPRAPRAPPVWAH